MTFVAALHSRNTIWIVADRRLTSKAGVTTDEAVKLLCIETPDGHGIVGYAGLGATANGTESSYWMSRVLRGRGLTMEQSLFAIASAMQSQFPKHLRHTAQNGSASHVAVGIAIVDGRPRTYGIGFAVDGKGKELGLDVTQFRQVAHIDVPVSLVLTGSGAVPLLANPMEWRRPVHWLAKANDEGRVPHHTIADALSRVAYAAHTKDRFTGPNSIVIWRNRGGGGSHQFYRDGKRTHDDGSIPTISRGMDIQAIVSILSAHAFPRLQALMNGLPDPGIDQARIDAQLSKLPTQPDEKLI